MRSASSALNLVGAIVVTSVLHCCHMWTALNALLLCKSFNAMGHTRCLFKVCPPCLGK